MMSCILLVAEACSAMSVMSCVLVPCEAEACMCTYMLKPKSDQVMTDCLKQCNTPLLRAAATAYAIVQQSSSAFVLFDNEHDYANDIQQYDAKPWCNTCQPDADLACCYETALWKLYLVASFRCLCLDWQAEARLRLSPHHTTQQLAVKLFCDGFWAHSTRTHQLNIVERKSNSLGM